MPGMTALDELIAQLLEQNIDIGCRLAIGDMINYNDQ
jgi:hypothetical protein